MINDQVQDRGGLKQVGFAASFLRTHAHSINKIGLCSEQFGKNGDDQARLAVFDGTQYDSPGMMEFVWQNYLLINMILAAAF